MTGPVEFRQHPEFFTPVQAELACWALFRRDPHLASQAASELDTLLRITLLHGRPPGTRGNALHRISRIHLGELFFYNLDPWLEYLHRIAEMSP